MELDLVVQIHLYTVDLRLGTLLIIVTLLCLRSPVHCSMMEQTFPSPSTSSVLSVEVASNVVCNSHFVPVELTAHRTCHCAL
jgi:hypothetical protein